MKNLKALLNPGKSFQDYLHVVFGSAIGRGVAFLNSIIIARALGPENFGVFTLFFAVMVMTWQMSSAFDTTYIRHAKVAEETVGKQSYLSCNLILKTIVGISVIMALLVFGCTAPHAMFAKAYAFRMTVLGVVAGLFLNYMMSLANVYREREQFRQFTFIMNIHTVIVFICSIVLLLVTAWFSLEAVLGLYLLAAAGVGVWSLLKIWSIEKPALPDGIVFKGFFAWGKWMFLLSLVFALFQRIDVLFLTRYFTPESVGIYSAGVQLVMVISVTTGALNNVLVPKVVGALESPQALRAYLKEAVVPVLMIALLILVLMAAAPFVITVLYGKCYESSVSIFRILSVGWLVTCFYMPLSFIYYALDKPKIRFFQEFSKLIIGIILLWILAPRYGPWGAGLAVTLAMTVNSFSSSLVLWQLLRKTSGLGIGYHDFSNEGDGFA